jgi:hypothetical protein
MPIALKKSQVRREKVRGNALFLILIAVALFAALSYAITQSGRGGGNVSQQTVLIAAGQLSEEPADIRAAIVQMSVSGVSPIGMTFSGTAAANDVFDQTGLGGGATNVPPPSTACNSACVAWTYYPIVTASTGVFVAGVGTNAPESVAYLGDISQAVCIQINKGLGLPGVTAATLTAAHQTTATFSGVTGNYSAGGNASTIHTNNGSLNGQAFGCWNNLFGGDTSTYSYYASLLDE